MNRRAFFRSVVVPPPVNKDLAIVESSAVGMDRRAFLRLLGASTAITTAALVAGVDAQSLVWLPDEKQILQPPEITLPDGADLRDYGSELFDRYERERAQEADRRSSWPRLLPNIHLATDYVLKRTRFELSRMAWHLTGPPIERRLDGYRVGDTVRLAPEVELFQPRWDPQRPLRAEVQPVTLSSQQYVTMRLTHKVHTRILDHLGTALAVRIRKDRLDVFAPLPVPREVESAAVSTDVASGLSVRGIFDYDIAEAQYLLRFDVLGGRRKPASRRRQEYRPVLEPFEW